jgi:hypothetical protein
VKHRAWCLLLAVSASLAPACTAGGQNPDTLAAGATLFAKHQLRKSITVLGDTAMFPRSSGEGGYWKLAKPEDWTSGFFPGCLWIGFQLTGDSSLLGPAARWTEKLESQQFNTRTHDVGFVLNCSYGNGIRVTSKASYAPILLTGARSLASRFNAGVGCIKSWDRRKWPFPVIIDNMMNLELLFWAAKNGGSHDLYDVAVSHAVTTMNNHFREDGSTYHVVSYDSITGAVLAKETHQGRAHESVWARGQAWAMYGFSMAFRETGDERFLKTAQRAADWFIGHLPDDHVPYWDFSVAAVPGEPRDASAAAIAASALLELGRLASTPGDRARYTASAGEILSSLCRPPYLAEGTTSPAILNHATGNKPSQSEIDVSLIYADYYFLEALLRYRKAGLQ